MSSHTSARSPHADEVFALFDAYVAGELDAAATIRLAELLTNDPNARRQFVELAHIEALAEQFEGNEATAIEAAIGPEGSASGSELLRTRFKRGRLASRRHLAVGLGVATVFLVALLAGMAIRNMPDFANKQIAGKQVEPKSAFIARLTNVHNGQWLDGTRPPSNDPRLDRGTRLAIASGVIEITYNTGAKILVEGPAEFYVGDKSGHGKADSGKEDVRSSSAHPSHANSGYLAHGRLVARCETAASQGFAVATSRAVLTDLGTEFAVFVAKDGETGVEVFDGRIELAALNAAGKVIARQVVADGESFSIDPLGQVATRASFAKQVVRSGKFAKLIAPQVDLLGFYTFEGDANDSSDHKHHAKTVSNIEFVDGYEGRAAQFAGTVDSYIDLPIDVSVDTEPVITWGAWVRPTAFGNTPCEILSTDDQAWDRILTIDNRFGGADRTHRFAMANGTGMTTSNAEPPQLAKWRFVAGIYDQRVHAAAIYVEDASSGRLAVDVVRKTTIGESQRFIRVGMHANGIDEAFAGEIDNVFILRGACNNEQLERIRTRGAAGVLDVAADRELAEDATSIEPAGAASSQTNSSPTNK